MIDLQHLRLLLIDEIRKAEAHVIQSVRLSLPGAKEDDITALFIVAAERALTEATDSGRVAAAVRSDLESEYRRRGHSPPHRLQHITDGLVARLRRQQPAEEKRTGGDFGLLVVEPHFDLRWDKQLDLQRGGRKRGLLVQAKRRFRSGRWNQLTPNQVNRLPERTSYTSLLRYDFGDSLRHDLQSFRWHLLSGTAVSVVSHWLTSGTFPDALATHAVIAGLSRGEYGTDDKEIIDREICPDAGSYIVIEIDWEDGSGPEDVVVSINREHAQQVAPTRQQVPVRVRA